ncbi:MAG: chloride channel protein [Roseovarius sp.]|nr:chloride channel protein [Roseovarius sp.]MCY4207313.1 chloride channel protein [Roseovarius sp.]
MGENWKIPFIKWAGEVRFWLVSLLIGIVSGGAALLFRKGVLMLESLVYAADDVSKIHTIAENLPWYWLLAVPVVGGLIVGLLLHFFTADGRPQAVPDVIEGAALNNGRTNIKAGLASTAASLITLGMGGSSGREGPVIVLAGAVSTWVGDRLKADGVKGRDLLGCAVAAAIAASFNAPIAGAVFAMEVILRHFSFRSFTPVVIASIAGSVLSRLTFGNVTEFALPTVNIIEFYVELPAFVLLGIVCGLLAAIFVHSIFFVENRVRDIQSVLGFPAWLFPTGSGVLLGIIAIWFPHIIGVGYETTSQALTGNLPLRELIVFSVVKVAAVAITIGGRMGGGVFSPSLMVGALTGLAFGLIATGMFPEVSGYETLYALAGMGAVAAAVLGSPISTILIVFELTGDWYAGLAVMLSISMSTAVSSKLIGKSFFYAQLERRGMHLSEGPQVGILGSRYVHMHLKGTEEIDEATHGMCMRMIRENIYLQQFDTLETAVEMFKNRERDFVPVVDFTGEHGDPELCGALFHKDALKAHIRALEEKLAEEHG